MSKDDLNSITDGLSSQKLSNVTAEISRIVKALKELDVNTEDIIKLVKSLSSELNKTSKSSGSFEDTITKVSSAMKKWSTTMDVAKMLNSVVTVVKSLTTAQEASKVATTAATVAQKGLNVAIESNPITVAIGLFLTILPLLESFTSSANNATNNISEMNKEMEQLEKTNRDNIYSTEGEISLIQAKAEKYEELRTKVNLTSEEQAILAGLGEDLQAAAPDIIQSIQDETGAYKDLSGAIALTCEHMRAKAFLSADESKYETLASDYKELKDEQDSLIAEKEAIQQKYPNNEYNYIQSGDQDYFGKTHASTRMAYISSRLDVLDTEIQAKETGLTETEKDIMAQSAILNNNSYTDENTKQFIKLYESLKVNFGRKIITEKEYYTELETLLNEHGSENNSYFDDFYKEIQDYQDKPAKKFTEFEGLIEKQLYKSQIGTITEEEYYAYLQDLLNKYDLNSSNEAYNSYRVELYQHQQQNKKAQEEAAKAAAQLAKEQAEKATAEKAAQAEKAAAEKAVQAEKTAAEQAAQAEEEEQQRPLNEFKAAYNEKKTLYEKGEITDKQYYSDLEKLLDEHNAETSSGYETYLKELEDHQEQVKAGYEEAKEAYEDLVNARIDAIDEELKAEQELLNAKLKAIDDEIQARKELQEDRDIQEEVDAVTAQLKYSQLDSFSKMELEKQLADLKDEQEEIAWQRQKEAEREAAQAEYEAAQAAAEEEKEELQDNLAYVNELLSNLASGAVTNNNSSVTNNNTSANIKIVSDALSQGQVAKKVIAALVDGLI